LRFFFENMDMNETYSLIESLREEINNEELDRKITFSAGLAEFKGGNVLNVLDKADQNLYKAKANGRNQTRF